MIVTQERHLSATDAEKLLGISASTIRTWYHRREQTGLYAAGRDRRGKPTFREVDLIRLRDKRRQVSVSVNPAFGELGRLLSARDAERTLGIPASTVSTWHSRKEQTGLYSFGLDTRRNPLFYEVDLIVLRRGLRVMDDEGQRINTMRDVGQ